MAFPDAGEKTRQQLYTEYLERYDPAILFAALAILLLLAESLLDVRLPGTGIATARSLARRSI